MNITCNDTEHTITLVVTYDQYNEVARKRQANRVRRQKKLSAEEALEFALDFKFSDVDRLKPF